MTAIRKMLRAILATKLEFKSFFSRSNALRVLFIFVIPIAFTLPVGNPYTSNSTAELVGESSFLIGRISFIILFLAVIQSVHFFSSRGLKLQTRAMFSHPVGQLSVFISRYGVLWFIIFLVQSSVSISVLGINWTTSTNPLVVESNPFFILNMILPILVTAAIIASTLSGTFVIVSTLIDRSDLAYVVGLLLVFMWALLSGALGGRDLRYYPLGVYSLHGLVRNSLLQLSGVEFPHSSVLEAFMGYPFTKEIYLYQLFVFLSLGCLSLFASYAIFKIRSRRW